MEQQGRLRMAVIWVVAAIIGLVVIVSAVVVVRGAFVALSKDVPSRRDPNGYDNSPKDWVEYNALLVRRGDYAVWRGHPADAIPLYREAFDKVGGVRPELRAKGAALIHVQCGQCYERLGNKREAIREYRAAATCPNKKFDWVKIARTRIKALQKGAKK